MSSTLEDHGKKGPSTAIRLDSPLKALRVQ